MLVRDVGEIEAGVGFGGGRGGGGVDILGGAL